MVVEDFVVFGTEDEAAVGMEFPLSIPTQFGRSRKFWM